MFKRAYRLSKYNVFLDDCPGEPADVLPDPILVNLNQPGQFPGVQLRAGDLDRQSCHQPRTSPRLTWNKNSCPTRTEPAPLTMEVW